MADTDDAILAAVETELPDPCVVRKALQYAEEAILRDTGAERHEVLAAELKEVKAAIRRLTMAIAAIP